MALGPVFDAVSDWILEPNRQHVEPEEVVSDRENSKNRDRDRNNQQSGSGINRNDREDMRGRNGREGGGGGGGDNRHKEETRGLAGYFFNAIYNAGASLFTGDFAALSLGSDAEDDTQVFIYYLLSILKKCKMSLPPYPLLLQKGDVRNTISASDSSI